MSINYFAPNQNYRKDDDDQPPELPLIPLQSKFSVTSQMNPVQGLQMKRLISVNHEGAAEPYIELGNLFNSTSNAPNLANQPSFILDFNAQNSYLPQYNNQPSFINDMFIQNNTSFVDNNNALQNQISSSINAVANAANNGQNQGYYGQQQQNFFVNTNSGNNQQNNNNNNSNNNNSFQQQVIQNQNQNNSNLIFKNPEQFSNYSTNSSTNNNSNNNNYNKYGNSNQLLNNNGNNNNNAMNLNQMNNNGYNNHMNINNNNNNQYNFSGNLQKQQQLQHGGNMYDIQEKKEEIDQDGQLNNNLHDQFALNKQQQQQQQQYNNSSMNWNNNYQQQIHHQLQQQQQNQHQNMINFQNLQNHQEYIDRHEADYIPEHKSHHGDSDDLSQNRNGNDQRYEEDDEDDDRYTQNMDSHTRHKTEWPTRPKGQTKYQQCRHRNIFKNFGNIFRKFVSFHSHFTDKALMSLNNDQETLKNFQRWLKKDIRLENKKDFIEGWTIWKDEDVQIRQFKVILKELSRDFFQDYILIYLLNSKLQDLEIHLRSIGPCLAAINQPSILYKFRPI